MEIRNPPRRSATLDRPDDMRRATSSPAPDTGGPGARPPKALILSGLALMLVVALVVTSAGVMQGLRSHSTGRASAPFATATPTPTRIAVPIDPKASGWTAFSPVLYSGDVKFAASSPQHGYICGQGPRSTEFGVTTDGGQHWQLAQSPAQFSECSVQVSPTNPLDLTLTSGGGSFGSDSPPSTVDAHYSTNGGKTWRTAPIPAGTRNTAGAVWSGPYLYIWSGPSQYTQQVSPQKNYLAVSANGGSFSTLDTSKLLPGVQGASIESVVATGDKLYVNLTYTGCAGSQCHAIASSADAGKTWTHLLNLGSVELVAVAGSTLYGRVPDAQNGLKVPAGTEVTSTDAGATWTALNLPPILGASPTARPQLALPAPDGTLFAAPDGVGIVYLSDGKWTLLPFSAYGENIGVAVAVDSNSKPATVWAIDDGNDSFANIYSHALP